MVTEQFPMFKLVTQLARQVTSPVASKIKEYAVSHPRFGAQVCSRSARLYQRCEWLARKLVLRLAGVQLSHAALPPPLPARRAQDLGGDLLGEVIIFALGALIVIFEVNRQANKQEAKVLEERSAWLAVTQSLQELQHEVSLQQHELERLRAALRALLSPPEHLSAPAPRSLDRDVSAGYEHPQTDHLSESDVSFE